MEGFKEFQGRDLDDAIGQACSYYDTLREKLEIDIVHDSKSGIFGIVGARKAKIKARRVQLRNAVDSILGRSRDTELPENAAPQNKNAGRTPRNEVQAEKAPRSPEQPRAENSRSENVRAENSRPEPNRSEQNRSDQARPENSRSEQPRREDATAEGRKPRAPRPPRNASPRPTDSGRQPEARQPEYGNDGNSILTGQVQGFVPDPENDEEASYGPGNEMPAEYADQPGRNGYGSREERAPRPRRPRPARNGGPRTEGAPAPGTSVLAGTLDNDALNEDALSEGLPMVPFDQLDQDRLRAISLEAVGRLVSPIVGDVPLSVELGDNRVNVVLDCGDDSGLLIGREGQTLASLQYLASRLVSRAMEAAVRVQLDTGEYRLRQDEKLRDLALALAERVRASGKSHSTRPLSSYHRRIVHMALQEVGDVQTRSSGDGALKRVVIQKKRGN